MDQGRRSAYDSLSGHKMHNRFDYDVAILGGGSAGYAAARATAAAGLRTVMMEGRAETGGLCILRGCMPTKALLYAAEVLHLARRVDRWGLRAENIGFDFAQVMSRKDTLIQNFAEDRRQQLAGGQFTFLQDRVKFLDSHTLAAGEARQLTAAKFVITTGSIVAAPPLPQLRAVGYLTSDDILQLKQLPKSLIILGGGPLGVEFAQFFARFGVQVTLLHRRGHILPKLDTDAAEEMEKVFHREGIEIFSQAELTGAHRDGKLKTILFQHGAQAKSVAAEEILFALGRVPNTASLGLDTAGVATEDGRIVTNECQQTSVSHIYAAGDCTGRHEIVHLAIQQGETAAYNIIHPDSPRRMDDRLLLSVIFTEPQVAFVGLTEKAAVSAGIPYLSARHDFRDHGKSLIMDTLDGSVKLLADPQSGEILGGACVGPQGGELIHEIVVALAKRMTVHEFARLPHYHPTLAEIWTYPAASLAGQIPAPP